ncbi:MAG: hypothetical protein PHU03_01905 [Syntrophales bacterium]|nr:hypothetical protein [Syntrophales bacterium]
MKQRRSGTRTGRSKEPSMRGSGAGVRGKREPTGFSRFRAWWGLLPLRTRLSVAGIAALIIILVLLALPSGEDPVELPAHGASGREAGANGEAGYDAEAGSGEPAAHSRAMIRSVLLEPPMPTRFDVLTVEVVPMDSRRAGLSYRYEWKVNDRAVKKSGENSLDLSPFKVRDLVSVTVFPHDKEIDLPGFAFDSPLVAIHGAVPTLTLEAAREPVRPGETIRLHLASHHPDGGEVVFNLEEPLVPGMTIDRGSGEIRFNPSADQRGAILFGASVEDLEGTKVSKIFEFTLMLE